MSSWDDDEILEDVIEMLIHQMSPQKRRSLAEARRYVIDRLHQEEADVDRAVARIEELRQKNLRADDVINNPATRQQWYLGPQHRDVCWPRYCETLKKAGRGWMIPALDGKTTSITALLSDPSLLGVRRKGLVVGNVQSGKTANYTGVIAKAVDAGYRFVIVLAGVHNNLRRQTQLRLESDLVGDDWIRLTNSKEDFGGFTDSTGLFNNSKRMIAVVKKNGSRLRNLCEWLASVPEDVRRRCPLLIVDDESDQATPNTQEAKDEVSAINDLLRKLWELSPTGSYLAYTATPFANVLMDPDNEEDLFPSDFITGLEVGEGYFGPARVFGTAVADDDPKSRADLGLDMVRLIPEDEVAALRPPSGKDARLEFDPELPSSLLDAVDWFVVATAIRRARGQAAHSSMLVHTTHYAAPHEKMKGRLREYVESVLRPAYSRRDLSRLERSWEREISKVPMDDVVPVSWEVVSRHIGRVLLDLDIKVDNGSSDDRLDYQAKGADGNVIQQTVIAIGGGTLSRGLTLEGLVVSYFTRSTNTYDTLLQMGRWFGYRPGYGDLPRIWVSQGLDDDYAFLSLVEEDLRNEIRSFEGTDATPAEVGVRIRSHPGRLQVTADNKMFHAKQVQVGLAGQLKQTYLLDGSDPDIVRSNIAAVNALAYGGHFERIAGSKGNSQRWVRGGLTSAAVSQFLQRYSFYSDKNEIVTTKLVTDWIEKSAPFANWSLAIIGRGAPLDRTDGLSVAPVGLAGLEVNPVSRAPLGGGKSTPERLNFKGVVSPGDRMVDVDPRFNGSVAEGRKKRRLSAPDQGLILVYPISRYSVPVTPSTESKTSPRSGAVERVALAELGVTHDLLALGLLFPDSASGVDEGDFVSVRADWEIEAQYDEYEPVVDKEGDSHMVLGGGL